MTLSLLLNMNLFNELFDFFRNNIFRLDVRSTIELPNYSLNNGFEPTNYVLNVAVLNDTLSYIFALIFIIGFLMFVIKLIKRMIGGFFVL